MAVSRRATLVEDSRLISGIRVCSYPYNTTEWLESACCNPSLLFYQCCAPTDVDVKSNSITSLQGLDVVSNMFPEHFKLYL